MIGAITSEDWKLLKEELCERDGADYLEVILEQCRQLWRICEHCERNPLFVNSSDMRQIFVSATNLISEYKRFIELNLTGQEDRLKLVRQDIHSHLSAFLTPEGRLVDWSTKYQATTISDIPNFIQYIIAPLVAFAQAKIYSPLKLAKSKSMSEIQFMKFFIPLSAYQAGMFPEAKEKPSIEALKLPEKKEEEKTKKEKEKKK